MQSLTEKYRPKRLADLVGQPAAVAQLQHFTAKPYSCALLFHGPTGTGKTSAALALATELGCGMEADTIWCGGFDQISAGEQTADDVRARISQFRNIPGNGSGWRILVVNEADICSTQVEALWLDVLENLPPKNVVIFTTNEVDKLKPRFQDRCMVIPFTTGVNGQHMQAANALIGRIWEAERPGEAIPCCKDLGGAGDGSPISFRKVVQSAARRLLDPAPFVPAPVGKDIFEGSSIKSDESQRAAMLAKISAIRQKVGLS